jgi:hypothetical protein
MIIGPGSIAHMRPVTLGIQTPETNQILDGVSLSDMVITNGAYALDDGVKVKIGKPPAEKVVPKANDGTD